jgi:hypothetical protein
MVLSSMQEVVDGVVDLLGRYLAITDSGDADAGVELFTENGAVIVGDRSYVGHEGVHNFFAGVVPGVHSCGLAAVSVLSGEATSTCPYLYISSESGTVLAGHYFDRIDTATKPYRFIERKIERGAQAAGT